MVDLAQELEEKLTGPGSLQDRIALVNSFASSLRFKDIRQAIAQIAEIRDLVDHRETTADDLYKPLADVQLNLGQFYTQVGEYESALQALQQAKALYEKTGNQKDVILSRIHLGRVFLLQGSFVNALEQTLVGFELVRNAGNRDLEGALLINFAMVYILREEYTRAFPYLLRTLQLAKESNNRILQATALEKICCIYTGLRNPEAALDSGRAGLQIYHETSDRQGEAEALNSLGLAYQALQDYPSAMECYTLAAKAARKIELRYEEMGSLIYTASLHSLQEQHEEAVNALGQALAIAEQIGAKGRIVAVHQALSGAYRAKRNYQKALYHYENFHELKEQIFDSETEAKLRNLEVVYQVEAARQQAEDEQAKNRMLQKEIKERAQAQKDLKAANTQLEEEIKEREQLISDLDAFSRMVAHDLKTPLQNLALLSYLLDRELMKFPESENARGLVKQIQQTGLKTGSIINELLTLASLRSTDVEYKSVEMDQVVREVMRRLKFMVEECKAEVNIRPDYPGVKGHAPWIEEILANLLSNAIHYGGEPPVIEVGADPKASGFIRFWVKDNGNGIDPQQQVKLFQDFTRLGSKREGSHGLGLSIARRIVTKLGGEIGVKSTGKPGEGAVFWFTLPAPDEPPAEGGK